MLNPQWAATCVDLFGHPKTPAAAEPRGEPSTVPARSPPPKRCDYGGVGEKKLPSEGPSWIVELDSPGAPSFVGAPVDHRDDDVPVDRGARSRRRRWLVWIALAVVISYVLAVGIDTLTTGTPSPPAPPAPPAVTLHVHTGATLVWAFDSLHMINADTGASRTLPVPGPAVGGDVPDDVPELLSAMGSLVVSSGVAGGGSRAWLYTPGLNKAPLDLGSSAGIASASSGNGVWLWDIGTANAPVNQVRLVDLTGHQMGLPAMLPTDWHPTGQAVDDGLVLSPRFGGSIEVWDPTSKNVVRSFPDGVGEIAASRHLLAWVRSRCMSRCILHLTDLSTGLQQDVPLPSNVWPVSGAFSPDGATLAVSGLLGRFMSGGHPAREHFAQTAEVVVVVDAARGTARVLPGSKRPGTVERSFPLMWSPNGWLFFTDYGSPYVEAWHPTYVVERPAGGYPIGAYAFIGMRTAGVLPNVRLPNIPPPGPRGQQLPALVVTSPASPIGR